MKHFNKQQCVIVFLLCCFLASSSTNAQAFKRGGKKKKGFGFQSQTTDISLEEMQTKGLVHTGLKPVYPTEATCLEVASFFGDKTRYDGSFRTLRSNHGYHGGIDISVPIGTPIVAIADGTVVQIAEAGRLVGIKITLQHAPEDTGLPIWTYSKYQHLDEHPKFEVGEKVKMGQIIGLSGRTGTTGGHYGYKGYPHLHMNVYTGESDKFKIEGHKLKPKKMKYIDPLAFYFQKELDSNVIKNMPAEEKSFPIPFMDKNGKAIPSDTKVVWPFLCEPR